RSTGEVASLGKTFEDALIKSWLSATPNRLPKNEELIMIYTAVHEDKPLLSEVSYIFKKVGYDVVTIEGMSINGSNTISYDESLECLRRGDIGLVITTGYTPEKDYEVRRLTVDLNIPLILNANLAYELSKAIRLFKDNNLLMDVRELSEYYN
ncbi:MAG: carbamoyl phosphate synthase large subunit, partial [Desulfurococcaceae archaeon]|nr:carbamoyl phosphate synthase large subunit [Desulfurococcaceae archaeon]